MRKGFIATRLGASAFFLLLICIPVAETQQQSDTSPTRPNQSLDSAQDSPLEEIISPVPVMIDGFPILTVYETVGGHTPEERAHSIQQRIVAIATSGTPIEAVTVEPHEGWIEIRSGSQVIMAVTAADAKMAGKPRQKLAADYAQIIDRTIRNYRRDHNWRMMLRGFFKTLIASAVFLVVLWLVRRIRFALGNQIRKQIHAAGRIEEKSAWLIAVAYFGPIALTVGSILRWILILALFETYFTVTLGFFPPTREISLTVTKWVLSQLELLGDAALDYLPNLLVIAVIALVTHSAIRLVRFILREIGRGNFKVHGFYSDWADPTEKLIRMLVLALALVVAFPYLPGAKSPAFQGISIFLGVLLSLGSSSAVANAIAGIILTYMRSFLVGDWVQIGDTTGEVVEKNLLVTRVLTPKAEVITIPNATVMGGSVKNYSVEARKSGVIFYTTVTIGYDAPWRTIHQLLVDAALATQHILKEPIPFVLQKALEDFYVAYELNAYTDAPLEMLNIFSNLHQNIQDKFNDAGVEICSPHFSSLRDGNVIAIPDQYIKPNYRARSFRVAASEGDGKDSSVQKRVETFRQTR
jgi:small-conductance mechanosensitive channel